MNAPLKMDMMLNVITPTAVEDAIYNAVEAAIDAGWDARRFKLEAADAWEYELRKRSKWAVEELRGTP